MTIWLISLLSTLTLAGEALPPASRPSPAVEQAARQYRIEIYNRYHNDRAEYNRRIAIGQEIFQQYEDTCFEADPQEVTNWYIAAARQSATSGEIAAPRTNVTIAAKPRELPTEEVARIEIVFPKTRDAVTSTNKAATPAQPEPVFVPAAELPIPAVQIEYPAGYRAPEAGGVPAEAIPLANEKRDLTYGVILEFTKEPDEEENQDGTRGSANLIDTFFRPAQPAQQPKAVTDVDPFQP